MKFSRLSESIAPSEILAVAGRVRELAGTGQYIHNFTIGDFNPQIFPIPFQLEESIVHAYRSHLTNYPQAEGNSDLREAILNYAHLFQHLKYTTNEIVVASGGRPLIYALYQVLCDPGDVVIYPVPSWNNNYYTHIVSGSAVELETREENSFLATAEEIEPHLAGATLLALCSPQNPAGTVYTREELQKICALVVKENEQRDPGEKKLYLLFDQLYSQLVYEPACHYNPVQVYPPVRPYTITIDAVSKSFSATGLRVGWCFGPEELITRIKVLLSHMGAWAPMPEQKGLADFLGRNGAVWVFLNNFRLALKERLDSLYKGVLNLRAKGYPIDAIAPQGAVFLSVKIDLSKWCLSEGQVLSNPEEVTQYLLHTCHIAVVPFYAFGSKSHPLWYRLSVGTCTTEEIRNMLKELEEALQHLQPLNPLSSDDRRF